MGEDRVERRLAAILAGDMAGYSRLVSLNEEGTLHDQPFRLTAMIAGIFYSM
jgi:class 3 adenylate cyclase